MKCRLCGKYFSELTCWLERVNPKGESGIWECRPMCGADLPADERVIGAIEGQTPETP